MQSEMTSPELLHNSCNSVASWILITALKPPTIAIILVGYSLTNAITFNIFHKHFKIIITLVAPGFCTVNNSIGHGYSCTFLFMDYISYVLERYINKAYLYSNIICYNLLAPYLGTPSIIRQV